MSYRRSEMRGPRLAGSLLKAVVGLAESPLTGGLVGAQMLGQLHVPAFRALHIDAPAAALPLLQEPHGAESNKGCLQDALVDPSMRPEGFVTSADLRLAYESGTTTPAEVAERAIAAIQSSERQAPPLNLFIAWDANEIRAQARASTLRWAAGEPLGPLDGVPVAVKDELDMAGYPTTAGTSFAGYQVVARDATTVARLRQAGAVLLGKTNMHEIGIGVTGVNPHHGAVRNPYDVRCVSGGSSSGSGAAVSYGVCPIALGCDGGGSVRIPSALCGVPGLKPTFGRVSEHGAAPLCWSVAHVGVLGASVHDVALGYGLIAGPDAKDLMSARQPAVALGRLDDLDVNKLRLGWFPEWFQDAQPDIVTGCRQAIDHLQSAGATVVEVELEHVTDYHLAHLIIITSEMRASQQHRLREQSEAYGLDVRLNLAMAAQLSSADYVHAQRLRYHACVQLAQILTQVDVLLTPSTAITAPRLSVEALAGEESDIVQLDAIMRYATLANLTGNPALCLPVAYDAENLPIGLQLIGRPYDELKLLRLARHIERNVTRHAPQRRAQLLDA